MTKVMISCGEPSGDLYAAALASELQRLDGAAQVFGLGGDRLAATGARLVGHYRGLSVTGLVEALAVVPRSVAMLRRLVAAARAERPDVLVTVDFPDFNFRLAKSARRLGLPVVYYVSPQVWAWRPGRLKAMRRFVDRMLVIFPFEEGVYREAGIPVEFVGHPLVDVIEARSSRESLLRGAGLDPHAPTVALLPGSRPNEVRLLLPVLMAAAVQIAERVPGAQFVVARAPNLGDHLFAPLRNRDRPVPPPVVLESWTDDVLAASDAVVTASGTATVQTALHGRPMVIVYKVAPLTYRLGRRFVHVNSFGMVNLVAGDKIVPELIQDRCTPEAIADETVRFLTDADHAARTRASLLAVRGRLGAAGASRRAAQAVLAAARRGDDGPTKHAEGQ